MGCDAICIFAIRVQNKYSLCIGWEQISLIIYMINDMYMIWYINLFSCYKPDLDYYQKHFPHHDQAKHNKLIKRWGICLGESYFREYTFFPIGSVVDLVVITTPMPSLHNCHHCIIAIIMILIIISMRKRQDKRENAKDFELLIATLTRTELHWPPVTIHCCYGGKRIKTSVHLFCAQGFYTTCARGYWEWQGVSIIIYNCTCIVTIRWHPTSVPNKHNPFPERLYFSKPNYLLNGVKRDQGPGLTSQIHGSMERCT